MIRCPDGDKRIEHLRIGDEVSVFPRGKRRIRYIIKYETSAKPDEKKLVRIQAGAIGEELPSANLKLVVGQRVLITNPEIVSPINVKSGSIPARALTKRVKIGFFDEDEEQEGGCYYGLLFDDSSAFWANDLLVESIYLNEATLEELSSDDLNAILPIVEAGDWLNKEAELKGRLSTHLPWKYLRSFLSDIPLQTEIR